MSRDSAESFTASEEALHEKALAAVGFDDFGDPSYRNGLRVLLESLDRDANLSPIGTMIFRGQIVNSLATRLRVEQRLKDDPSVLENAIRQPIVITGLVRTGSTALHYLMGRDPGLQKLEYWLSARPQARPPRSEWNDHPDYQSAKAELEFLYETTPSLMAVHEMHPDWPEECRHILDQNFTDDRYEVAATLPLYTDWYHATTHRETYVRHKKLIQLIGSTDPKRRWLLKYPVHLRQLAALLEIYPDACIVQTHRDPRAVIASYTSFVSKVRELHERSVDVPAIAKEQATSWADAAEAGIQVRQRYPAEQFYDLHFEDFMSDPIRSVKQIYGHFRQELSAAGERQLEDWQAAHPQGKHGEHRYEKCDIGISEHQILDHFAGYMEYFGMPA